MDTIKIECEAKIHHSLKETSLYSLFLVWWLVFGLVWVFFPALQFHIPINLVLENLNETL